MTTTRRPDIHAAMTRRQMLADGTQRVVDVPAIGSVLDRLGATMTMDEALGQPEAQPLDLEQRHELLDQLTICLDEIYVHRDLKRVKHAVDPVTALKRLRRDCATMDGLSFHLRIMEIFKGLRDQHTAYVLPEPYCDMIAFLPFLLGACAGSHDEHDTAAATDRDDAGWQSLFAHDDPCVIVTHVMDGFEHPHFGPGAEVLTWNGMPIDIAVRRIGRSEQASNAAAEFALGVRLMSVRWLGGSIPPEEYFVTIGYRAPDDPEGHHHVREIRFGWHVVRMPGQRAAAIQGRWDMAGYYEPSEKPDVSVDQRSLVETVARQNIFVETEREVARPSAALITDRKVRRRQVARTPLDLPQDTAKAFRAAVIGVRDDHRETQFGLMRIVYFGKWATTFKDTFVSILGMLPQDGLVIDLRSNPGGEIRAAERVLQTLTDKTITPLPFQFRANAVTEQLTTQTKLYQKPEMADWLDLVRPSADIGSQFSRLGTMTSPDVANDTGRVYHGPVIVVTNAITYSAGDIFAASFQDHGIGKVLGVDEATGGGGANMWPHGAIVQHAYPNRAIRPLPGTARMHMAVRRCTRVGARLGLPIEEAGVTPDLFHRATRRDLLEQDADLMGRLAEEIEAARDAREIEG